jgi:hypothetical protein
MSAAATGTMTPLILMELIRFDLDGPVGLFAAVEMDQLRADSLAALDHYSLIAEISAD